MANDAWYTNGKLLVEQQSLDLTAATSKLILVTTGYTFSQSHDFVADLGATELTVVGYVRKTNGTDFNLALSSDETATPDTLRYTVDQAVTWSALAAGETIGALSLISDTGNDATSPLIAHFGQSAGIPTNGGDITAPFDVVNGNLTIEVPVAA